MNSFLFRAVVDINLLLTTSIKINNERGSIIYLRPEIKFAKKYFIFTVSDIFLNKSLSKYCFHENINLILLKNL